MPNHLDSLWNDASRVERLQALHKAGMRPASIARELSSPGLTITRGAVVGKIHRMGLGSRQSSFTLEDKLLRQRQSLAQRGPISAPEQHKAQSTRPELTYADARMIPLLELEPGECRFPFGDGSPGKPYLFCGLPAKHGSYCAHCFGVATEPRVRAVAAEQPSLGVAA